jgi:hypothetical protein
MTKDTPGWRGRSVAYRQERVATRLHPDIIIENYKRAALWIGMSETKANQVS